LEGQLEFTPLDDNIGEIQQVDFERIEHAFTSDDDLFGLFLDGQRSDQSSHFLSGFPLGELAESLLSGPGGGMDDLQVELSVTGVEDENGSVDGFGGQVAFEGLVDGHSVDIGVVHEPNDLVGEEFRVVLGVQVRFRRFRGIQLQSLSDTFSEDIEGGVGLKSLSYLHDLVHGLLHERLTAREPVPEGSVQVVAEVQGH